MDFLQADRVDQDACYHNLVTLLHPASLTFSACKNSGRLGVHHLHHAPVLRAIAPGMGSLG